MKPWLSDRAKQELNFALSENDRKLLALFDDDLVKDRPRGSDLEMIAIEGAQGNLGLIHGARLVLLVLAKEDEVVAGLIFRKDFWIRIEVPTNQSNVRNVRVLGALPQITELDEVTERC